VAAAAVVQRRLPANTIPVANSGPDQTVDAGVTVTLDGSGSSDADGTIAGYTWTQTAGTPTVTLSSRTVAQPTFRLPRSPSQPRSPFR
jgi:hypothetical protein